MRLLLFFALTGYSLFMKDVTGSVKKSRSHEGQLAGDGLRNSLVLTWSFLEMIIWFWVSVVSYVALWASLICFGRYMSPFAMNAERQRLKSR